MQAYTTHSSSSTGVSSTSTSVSSSSSRCTYRQCLLVTVQM